MPLVELIGATSLAILVAVLAFATRQHEDAYYGAPRKWVKNRYVAAGIALILVVAMTGAAGLAVYEFGQCTNGFKGPARCARITNAVGGAGYGVFFVGLIWLPTIGVVFAGVLGLAEWMTRRKMRDLAASNARKQA